MLIKTKVSRDDDDDEYSVRFEYAQLYIYVECEVCEVYMFEIYFMQWKTFRARPTAREIQGFIFPVLSIYATIRWERGRGDCSSSAFSLIFLSLS